MDEWEKNRHRMCTCDHRFMTHFTETHPTKPLKCMVGTCPCKKFKEVKRG